MPTLAERLSIIIDATGVGAISEFKKVGSAAKSEMAAADKAMSGTRKEGGLLSKGLSKLGLDSIDTGAAMKAGLAAGATVAATAIVKFGRDSISAFSDLTEEVSSFKRVAGGTAQSASLLVGVMGDLKIDTNNGAKAFQILSKNIETTPSKLSAIGVEVAKNKDGTTDLAGTLLNVADAYTSTNDQAEKNVIAMTAFGKSGQALVPILERGRDGIKDLYAAVGKHELFSDSDLEKGKQFRRAMNDLSDAFEGFELEAGKKLVPVMTNVIGTFTSFLETVDDVGKSDFGKIVAEDINHITGANAKWQQEIEKRQEAEKKAAGITDKAAEAAAAGYDSVADAEAAAAEEALKYAEASEKANQALLDTPGNALAVANSLLDLEQDLADTAEKQKAYNDAVREFGPKSAEARQANLDLQRQILSTKGDVISYAEEQARLNGHTGNAADQARGQLTALMALEKQFPEMTAPIEAYIAELLKIPGTVRTYVNVRTVDSGGRRGLNLGMEEYATGGMVPGPKGSPHLAIVHGGEYVVPAGGAPLASNGDTLGGSVTQNFTINVNGGLGGGHEIGQAVVDAIVRWERRNGSGWRRY